MQTNMLVNVTNIEYLESTLLDLKIWIGNLLIMPNNYCVLIGRFLMYSTQNSSRVQRCK